jgi:hypothetical protein
MLKKLADEAESKGRDESGYRAEFIQLVKQGKVMVSNHAI